jgi:hypothetical protein
LINELTKINFDIITLGYKNIIKKKELLENTSILITPLGANIMNLIFTNTPHHIIFL